MPVSLNDPFTLPCGVILPNRIAKAAMTEGLSDKNLQATERLANLYAQLAAELTGHKKNALYDRALLLQK